jgi:DNA topoisomerase-1
MPPKKVAPMRVAQRRNAMCPNKVDTTLVIVESPSKCQKIGQILGENYKVVASKGHLYEIDGLRAIDKKTWLPKYTIIKHQFQTVENLRRDVSIAPRVLLATDGDREGECIAHHICLICGLPPETTMRIIFHEITPRAILEAVANPTLVDMSLVHAQQARAVLDILVGYKISPILWKYIPRIGDDALSAGRCQTPALRLVYDKCGGGAAAVAAPPAIKYKVYGYFFNQNYPFLLDMTFSTANESREFLEKSRTTKHVYLGAATPLPTTVHEKSGAPLNTSALIQACSNQLHISPKQTMQISQKLYQNGYITYMRTSNRTFSVTFLEELKKFIAKKYGNNVLAIETKLAELDYPRSDSGVDRPINEAKRNGFCGGGSAGGAAPPREAHEAIRPTHIETDVLPDDCDAREKSVYRLIRNHTLESCMRDAEYDQQIVCIERQAPLTPHNQQQQIVCIEGQAPYKYALTIQRLRVIGWKILAETPERRSAATTTYNFFMGGGVVVPPKVGTVLEFQKIETIATFSLQPHCYYTEASLVNELERLEIGRPSTYGMLVDVIQQRGYVKKQNIEGTDVRVVEYRLDRGGAQPPVEITTIKKFGQEKDKLVIQNTGVLAMNFLLKYFDELFSYSFTAKMEERLDKIAHNQETAADCCRDINTAIKKLITPVAAISKTRHLLDEHHEVIFSAQGGPVIKYTPDLATPETFKYKSIKKNVAIDIVKLDHGEYKLDDLIELQNDYLGDKDGIPMYLRNGRFGLYVECGDKKETLKGITIPIDQITMADVERFLFTPHSKNILRTITPELSVRKGKYGAYLFYQPAAADAPAAPKFINLSKKFRAGYMTCPAEELIQYATEHA